MNTSHSFHVYDEEVSIETDTNPNVILIKLDNSEITIFTNKRHDEIIFLFKEVN